MLRDYIYPFQFNTDLRHIDSAGVIEVDHSLYRLSRNESRRWYSDTYPHRTKVETTAERTKTFAHFVIYADLMKNKLFDFGAAIPTI